MKYLKYSFLFYYLSIFFICCLYTNNLYSQQTKDSSRFYYNRINSPKKYSDLPSGYNYFYKHKIASLLKEDTLRAIYDLRMVAISQLELGLIFESEKSVLEAITLLDNFQFNDTLKDSRIGLYNHLGRVYRFANDYEKAIEIYNEALKISSKLKDSISIINNKANIYTDLKDYNQAIKYLLISYNYSIKHKNKLKTALVLNNLGFVQSKLNFPEALGNLQRSLEIRKNLNDIKGVYLSYKNLFYYYLEKKDRKMALYFANKAYEIVMIINNKAYTQDILSLYMELYDDPKIIEYKRLTDSINIAKHSIRNIYSFNKYRYDKQEKIAQENLLQKEKEKRFKLIYLSLAIAIFLIFIASYFVFNARKKKIKIEQNYKTETQISKRIHDELANEMYQVMTKLQGTSNNQDDILDNIEEIYHKTRNISKNYASLDLRTDFEKTLNDLLMSYKSNEVAIFKRNIATINWEKVSEIKKMTVYRVLQELMTNMKKHSKATHVAITFNKKNNKIIIEYKDNGVGGILKKQNGLTNTENRMESIGGTISFETELNKGFKTIMIF